MNSLAKGTLEPLVLKIVSDQPMHGYGILRTIRQKSEEVLDFKEGALYPLLHQMERQGLLTSVWEDSESGRKRKTYQITAKGRRQLEDATRDWKLFQSAIDRILCMIPTPSCR